jgi:nitrite transporter NirC
MIWWCMFTFITSGYEHSIANMHGLMLGYLLPHDGYNITLWNYGYNLLWATLGNVVGGAIFVAGMYWMGSPKARELSSAPPTAAEVERLLAPSSNGTVLSR